MSQSPEAAPGKTPFLDRRARGRLAIGPAVLLVGAAVEAGVWIGSSPDRTMQVMRSYYVVPSTLFLLLLWWVFLSGRRWRTRLIGVGVLAAAVGGFFLLFRHVGFSGDFVPLFAPRWQATPEQQAEAWRSQRRQAAADGDGVAESDGVAGGAAQRSPQPDGGTDVTDSAQRAEGPAALQLQPPDEGDWPQFRGPGRDGVVRGASLRRDWDVRPPRLLWRHPMGPAWSSFAVTGRHAFTQEQRGDHEAVVCYDLETGDELWAHTDRARHATAMGGVGPRATPTVADARVYALGATGILNCLDAATGRRLWTTNILEDAGVENAAWGMAGSPLVYDDFVVVNPGGDARRGADAAVAAYDRLTGKRLWAHGQHRPGYTAPQLATLLGVRQVLVFDADGLGGHDAETGHQLWRFPWTNSERINVACPIVLDERTVFVSTGYGKGSALVEVPQAALESRLQAARSEARPAEDSSPTAAEATGWKTSTQLKLKFNDAVVRDGLIYGLDESILACFDPATGQRRWKGGRYGYGQVLLVDDLLLVQAESGDVVLVEATPEAHREVARFPALSSRTWNHPVLVHGRLLVRNAEEAACYDLGD